MRVADLVPRLTLQGGIPAGGGLDSVDRSVTAIAFDSREVTPGAIFVATKGQHVDATRFAADAVARGATLVVSESLPDPALDAPWLQVPDARVALAELATGFAEDPSHELTVVGVTGTNGKTTTTYLLSSIFEAAGRRCGRIGSIGYSTGGEDVVAERTTPEAPQIQALLRDMVRHRCVACAMEASSHALAMRRVDGTRFAAAVFCNLTRDHLDYHSDMEHYFEAKRRLFEMLPAGAPSILNVDDPWGRRIAETVTRPVTYGLSESADVRPDHMESTLRGTTLEVRTPRGRLQLRTSLPGHVNVSNVLAAVTTALALDIPFQAIEQGVASLDGVPGRFEVVSASDDNVCVLVDYAHTDDALRSVLEAIRALHQGQLVSLFGCGGDRDRAKRPLMGAVAARLSDLVILTSDNPRSEDPDAIIAEIRCGMETLSEGGARHLAISDRGAAIRRAIDEAEAGDVVVIAGKGHETEQVIGTERRVFDDRVIAREALARRRARARCT
ncbi:MAG: UDP-N-acetylmuramoyl-L-alanyl-D-glutamate--2,6-diaminopimelate ligase [Acidobacteriota bacterium]|nr:UDP-N-acetylmuramoyl-L-alanyl-D-glutamate--2,6-diaminopimelate ligase [Acidobacteriota bacterium]